MSDGRAPAAHRWGLLGNVIVSDDVERSRRFYTEVLGGTTIFDGVPTVVALSKSAERDLLSAL
ncbi:VOC family protein [Streptomyces sp. NPDC056682]|uniref:VOC family protein n=1 Tax=Streptomyces sp. NPDC056682 TaxID=3345909 RepID=UPI0036C17339